MLNHINIYLCGKCFTNRGYMKRHALTHTGDKPFPCTECRLAFTRNYLLTEHKQTKNILCTKYKGHF